MEWEPDLSQNRVSQTYQNEFKQDGSQIKVGTESDPSDEMRSEEERQTEQFLQL